MDFNQFMMDPKAQALLGMGGGLLQAAGPSRMPTSMGQGLSQGLLGLQSGYMSAIQHGLLADKIADSKKDREDRENERENRRKLQEIIGTPSVPGTLVAQEDELTRQPLPPQMQDGTPGTGFLGGQVPLEGLLGAQAKYGDPDKALGGLVDLEQSKIAANRPTKGGEYNLQQITDKNGKVWWADPRSPDKPVAPVMGENGKQLEERIPPNPGALPSVGRDFLLPLLQKVQTSGYNSLTPDEKKALEVYRMANPLNQLMGGMLEPELQEGREDYPMAPADPAQRRQNSIYKTPKGMMRWTGTGWQAI